MSSYYLLSWSDNSNPGVLAVEQSKSSTDLIDRFEADASTSISFELQKATEVPTGLIVEKSMEGLSQIWLDYLPNSQACPLMSDKMKSVIEKNLTGMEGVVWKEAIVRYLDGYRTYYILMFTERLDVLNLEMTTFVPGTDLIIRPVFSLKKASRFALFHKPLAYNLWKITPGLYVAHSLKNAIQKEKLTGVAFSKVSAL